MKLYFKVLLLFFCIIPSYLALAGTDDKIYKTNKTNSQPKQFIATKSLSPNQYRVKEIYNYIQKKNKFQFLTICYLEKKQWDEKNSDS